MDVKRYRLIVSGRVQGVGYRFFARDAARALGLGGWVRNVVDRSVEIEVEGEQGAIDGFIEELRQGPPLARVTDIEVRPMVAMGGGGDFTVRHGG